MKKFFVFLSFGIILFLSACTLTPEEKYDLKFLKDHYNNHQLDFSNINLRTIPPICDILTISGMQNDIFWVYLNGNKITSLDVDLSCLSELKTIDASFNQIKSLDGLMLPESTYRLDASHNKLTQASNLDTLQNLKELDWGYNELTTVEGFDSLTNLTFLALYHNKLTSIAGLQKLQNLNTIKLEFNQLTDVTHLEALKSLTRATVKYNPLPEDVIEKYTAITKKTMDEKWQK